MRILHLNAMVLLATAAVGCSGPLEPSSTAPSNVSSAAQGSDIAVSGTFTQTEITFIDVRSAGPNTVIDQTSRGDITGTIVGPYEDDLSVVVHPNGSFTAEFTITTTCTVDGYAGTLEFRARDQGTVVAPGVGGFSGTATIVAGSGDLASLRGALDIEGTVDLATGLSSYTYDGTLQWTP